MDQMLRKMRVYHLTNPTKLKGMKKVEMSEKPNTSLER